MLPTYVSASNIPASEIWFSLIGIFLFYTVLLIIEMYLMFRVCAPGPKQPEDGQVPLRTEQGIRRVTHV